MIAHVILTSRHNNQYIKTAHPWVGQPALPSLTMSLIFSGHAVRVNPEVGTPAKLVNRVKGVCEVMLSPDAHDNKVGVVA